MPRASAGARSRSRRRAALDLVALVRDLRARRIRTSRCRSASTSSAQRDGQPAARMVDPAGPAGCRGRGRRLDGDEAARRDADWRRDDRRATRARRHRPARRHLLVVTDGENTDGVAPADVARVMEKQDDDGARAALLRRLRRRRQGVRRRQATRRPGALGEGRRASSPTTLDELLSDRILVEAPRADGRDACASAP